MGPHLLPVKECLRSVLRNEVRSREFNHFVNLCSSMALALLERKAAAGQITGAAFHLSLKDLALDCIADLFRPDNRGIPLQLQVYFDCVDLDGATEEETLILLRRLVFSKVKQGLFRAYNESDPSLGKILRNIKIGIGVTGEFTEGDRFGDAVLVPLHHDPLLGKPMLQRESIGEILAGLPLRSDRIPHMLTGLSRCLGDQTDWCRLVGLLPLALAWRDFLSATRSGARMVLEYPDSDCYSQDVRRIVLEVCENVKKTMKARYVRAEGVDAVTYDAYFRAIAKFIANELWEEPAGVSLFLLIRAELPDLSESTYRARHRNTLEYLVKLVRKKARSELASAFG
jgi:hypothetical protein